MNEDGDEADALAECNNFDVGGDSSRWCVLLCAADQCGQYGTGRSELTDGCRPTSFELLVDASSLILASCVQNTV